MDEPCPRLSTASPVTPPPDAHPQDLLAPQAARPPPRFLPGRPRESPCPRRDTGGTAAAAGLTARHWFPGALIHFSDGISEVTKRRLREETAPPTPASVPPTSSFGPRPQLLLATNPDVPFTGASQGGGRGASGKISPLIGPSARQSCGAGLRRWVRRFLNMAEGEGWRVSSVGSGGPGTRVCRSGRAGTWSPAHAPVPAPAAAAPVRGLPRRVGALPQRRALPAPLLRPRRAAGLRAVAARPGQLPRVGGAPQRRSPGEAR